MRHLPLFSSLHIDSPCNEDWNAMTGDDRVRHCATCDRDVHNLSAMAREEAEALLRERTGPLCVRFMSQVPNDLSTRYDRLSRARHIAAAMSASLAVAACSPQEEATTTIPDASTAPVSVDADAEAPPFVDSGTEQSRDAGPSEATPTVRPRGKRPIEPRYVVMGAFPPRLGIAGTME